MSIMNPKAERLQTRAVYLELADSLSEDAFIHAYSSFCSLRRIPKLKVSDNGTNFTFVQPSLGTEIADRQGTYYTEWYFISFQHSFFDVVFMNPWCSGRALGIQICYPRPLQTNQQMALNVSLLL